MEHSTPVEHVSEDQSHLFLGSAAEVVVEIGEEVGRDSGPVAGRHGSPDVCQFSFQGSRRQYCVASLRAVLQPHRQAARE